MSLTFSDEELEEVFKALDAAQEKLRLLIISKRVEQYLQGNQNDTKR